jgi:hypothetical protein
MNRKVPIRKYIELVFLSGKPKNITKYLDLSPEVEESIFIATNMVEFISKGKKLGF